MNRIKVIHSFMKKKSNIDKRLKNEFIDNDIATIPCKVNNINDIISEYSIENYETLNTSFMEYIDGVAEAIPMQYPLVLNIIGHKFTKKEEEMIKETIESDYSYILGETEREINYQLKVFLFLFIGTILSGICIFGISINNGLTQELLFVLFWFFSESFITCIFFDGSALRKRKILAGRLACMKVYFSKKYDERDYTKKEAKKIFNDISK